MRPTVGQRMSCSFQWWVSRIFSVSRKWFLGGTQGARDLQNKRVDYPALRSMQHNQFLNKMQTALAVCYYACAKSKYLSSCDVAAGIRCTRKIFVPVHNWQKNEVKRIVHTQHNLVVISAQTILHDVFYIYNNRSRTRTVVITSIFVTAQQISPQMSVLNAGDEFSRSIFAPKIIQT